MFEENNGISSAVGTILAERNESHLAKFRMRVIPNTGNRKVGGNFVLPF